MALAAKFEEKKLVRIAAPMVRYSRLPFRLLCKKYGADVLYTPMIVSESFNRSQKARDMDFSTCAEDRPLIVQFAANSAVEFASAAEKVAKYADGVDLNCGCPQRWAMEMGYGSALIQKPELVKDMVTQAKEASGLPVSIKIRVNYDLKKTFELAQIAERIGASHITVHGRTPKQRSGVPVDPVPIKLVKESVGIPVVFNGDVFTDEDAVRFQEMTGVNGVMSARGLLANPALYAGYETTPLQCALDFIDIALNYGLPYRTMHQHIVYMTHDCCSRAERRTIRNLQSVPAIIDFFRMQGLQSGDEFL